jgi:glycosyltransferase involved in cell wall biosynthesis
MNKLRVAYFAEIFPSKSETWVHHEIQCLEKLGCEIKIFATHPRPSELPIELQHFLDKTVYLPELQINWLQSFKFILERKLLQPVLEGWLKDAKGLRNKAQIIRDLVYSGQFLKAVNAFNPDIVYCHFAGSRTNLALMHHLLTGRPFAFIMHAVDVFRRFALLKLKTASAGRVYTISNYNIEFISSHYPDIDISNFRKLSCGIDLSLFPFSPKRSDNALPTLVGVGRLVKMKGFDTLIKASAKLRDQGFEHKVILVGYGAEYDALQALINTLNLADWVELKGYASPTEVRRLLLEATAFVLPCIWDEVSKTQDGIPVAIMEAMALGVPVISTTTSGIPELIEHGVNGFLSAAGDSDELANLIEHVCTMDESGKLSLLSNARATIEQQHDAEKLGSFLLSELSDLLVSNKQPA